MPKSKPEVQVTVEVRPQPPTAAQLAAWADLWRLLAAPPVPTNPTGSKEKAKE